MKRLSFAVFLMIFAGIILAGIGATGHSPSSMTLDYDFNDQELTVEITHGVFSTSSHYIESITVYRNDASVIEEEYTSQPDNPTFTLIFDITAVDGDILSVYAVCSEVGDLEEEITVVGTREYMTLSVNPDPDEVEMDEDVYMTVNIYRENDKTPLDGVEVIPSPDKGFIGEVSELGLGAYGFTYEAPYLDREDIDWINLSCTKNGYHPLYFEVSFNLVLARDDSKDIVVEIDPIVYSMDEGAKKSFRIKVTAGGDYLDVPDIDVDYSHGKLSKVADKTGRFDLTYTANQVDSDTTGFIRVTASRSGFVTGSDEIQFLIKDTGDQPAQNDDNTENNMTMWIIIGGIIVVAAVIIVLIYRRSKNRDDEYEEVQIAEVIEDDGYQQL